MVYVNRLEVECSVLVQNGGICPSSLVTVLPLLGYQVRITSKNSEQIHS